MALACSRTQTAGRLSTSACASSARPRLRTSSIGDRYDPTMTSFPDRTEAAEYYFTYIDQVPAGDIREILRAQQPETIALLQTIRDDQSLYRYAPDKWSIRQLVGHVNDCERLFLSRAFWFARGFDTPLPSFDQEVCVAEAEADEVPWAGHLEEFRS